MREEYKNIIETYTEDDINKFKDVKRVSFNGFPMPLGCEPERFCTEEGFEKQIESFTAPAGLLYYFTNKDDIIDMSTVLVHKKKGAEAP